jgi:MFS family permease
MTTPEGRKHVRFNFAVNVIDAGFFGLGHLGLASLVTVIPLFLDSMGASRALIGLAGSLHPIGWQIPQLFIAPIVSRLARYKPLLLWMTINERLPLFGLMLVALLLPILSPGLALGITLALLAMYGLGAGLAAVPWQSMIGKIMPPGRVGSFFGVQSALANLCGAVGAVVAGFLLERLQSPGALGLRLDWFPALGDLVNRTQPALGFALCFGLAGVALMLSMGMLALTKEPRHPVQAGAGALSFRQVRQQMGAILRRDSNFRWFLVAKACTACAMVALTFYALYTSQRFQATPLDLGVMTGVLTLSQMSANLLFGWLGDRWGHRRMYAIGGLLMAVSAGLAVVAPTLGWMYLVFALGGMARATFWAVSISFTLEFGTLTERPVYIGMANTLIAPFSLGAPILGGALAQQRGYEALFIACAVAALLTAVVLFVFVYDPRFQAADALEAAPA